jgi:hypothetical protein
LGMFVNALVTQKAVAFETASDMPTLAATVSDEIS